MKTITISEGVVQSLVEALLIAEAELDLRQREYKGRGRDPMHDVRAHFFRDLRNELQRALAEGDQRPVCVGYEGGHWTT